MAAQFQILNKILQSKDYSIIDNNNLTVEYFFTYPAEFNYIKDHYTKFHTVPDIRTFKSVFEDFKIEAVQEPDSYLISELKDQYNLALIAENYNKIKGSVEIGDSQSAIQTYKDLGQKLIKSTSITSTDLTEDFSRLDHYKERLSGHNNYYITTGFLELDKMIGGIDALNENMVIVARTGVGKSWILIKMAAAAYAHGKRVGVYSGEMSKDKVGYRFDTLLGHMSNRGLNQGDPYVQTSYESYIQHMQDGTLGEIVSDFLPGGCFKVLTPSDLGGAATVDTLRAFIEKDNLDILFVDQYSLLEDTSKAKQTNERVANISKDIKNLQVLIQKPIISVSQMNRTGGRGEDGEEKEADASQIGLTDRIGQDATTVIFLSKKPISDEGRVLSKFEPGHNYTKYLFTFTVGKARDGGEGKIEYAVDLDTFTEVAFSKGNKLDSIDNVDGYDEWSDSGDYLEGAE